MKVFLCIMIAVLTLMLIQWVNEDRPRVGVDDIIPFPSHGGHSPLYNMGVLAVMGITIWGLIRLMRRK